MLSPEQLIQEFEQLREERLSSIVQLLDGSDPLVLLADVANVVTALYLAIRMSQAEPEGFVSNAN